MNVCWWWSKRNDSDDLGAEGSPDLKVDEPKAALHMERGNTESTVCTSFSFDGSGQNCPITGLYSDINVDYLISSVILGSGRYGTVRECTHRATGCTFAVKSVDKSKVGHLEYLQREVLMLSKIKHENIIKMEDCYEDETHVHIITEMCTGGELYDKIIGNVTQEGCLSEREAARIIKQLLNAVSYLHKCNCIHRDIKPENILFESSSHECSSIRLIDFGLSCHHSHDEPKLSAHVGSCYYRSPELLNRSYDRAADIWSVGVITYILLCGYSPFDGENDHDVAESIHQCNYTFVHGWDGVSDVAFDFIRCLLRKDPSARITADMALMHPWLKDVSTMKCL